MSFGYEKKLPHNISLRRMTVLDLDNVYAIEKIGQDVPWQETTFRDCLDAGYDGWVLEVEQNITGYILAYVRAGECHILNFCVNPIVRGHGHGHHLLNEVLQYAKEAQATIVLLEVRPSNHPALHLYRKFGFNEIGLRKDYYATADGGREDALVLALDLNLDI